MNNSAGFFKTNLIGPSAYKSFCPTQLSDLPKLNFDGELLDKVAKASSILSELEMWTKFIPSINYFISAYVQKEALMSSQIEGTQATLEDIFDPNIEKNKNADIIDVVNYVKAMNFAIDRLSTLPISNRLLKETHKILLANTRGVEKCSGEFRKTQNWIGAANSTITSAKYIPPNVDDMNDALADLEKYINDDVDDTNVLIRTALIHYQFETIHPFLDGNGRIGRLLIILYLIKEKIISRPTLYISYYLKKNRIEYYDRMTEVRRSGNYEQWIKFFMDAIIEAGSDAIDTIEKLKYLHESIESTIDLSFKNTKNYKKLLLYIEEHPIIDIKNTSIALGLSYNTINNIINDLIAKKILIKNSVGTRNKTFSFYKYIEILKSGT